MAPIESSEQLKVFISSKMAELRDVREIVGNALSERGIKAWVYEVDAGACPENIVSSSLQEVESADIFVGLFWEKYGEVTVAEYRRARALNKPCFIYIRDREHAREKLLEEFLRKEVQDSKSGVTYNYFDSAIEIGEQVATDIMRWLVRRHRELTAEISEANAPGAINQTLEQEAQRLQSVTAASLPQGTSLDWLASQLRSWFDALQFGFEREEERTDDSFDWVVQVPARRRNDRVLVRGIDGEILGTHVVDLRSSVLDQRLNAGWIVAARRVSPAARQEAERHGDDLVVCCTLDELIDEDVDFDNYTEWLQNEIRTKGIDSQYVPLSCTKQEIDPLSKQVVMTSRYEEPYGGVDGYVERWLDDPAKQHVSILGEFGTGKSWFSYHIAGKLLDQYQDAKARGTARPRFPLVIQLKDYAKAYDVEALLSDFFFRRFDNPLRGGFRAFERLNRMGRLLLIFDGFDEMAARVDRQRMVDNFWELARVIVPGSKAILTCRSEHFPDAMEGRALLGAELQASTASLTGEAPQFEVLELLPLTDDQIKRVLSSRAPHETVKFVLESPELMDLARRPLMIDLMLEALPDLELGKPVDISRVYLYAVKNKMERDIRSERTFTSLADKLYFMCELSWEMLINDLTTINYREFPDRLTRLFGPRVRSQKDLDHWHYDMMGQTLLVRTADGDYSPAHRSLLEFFVAYKLVAELGVLDEDFLDVARIQTGIRRTSPRDYRWSEYFRARDDQEVSANEMAPLGVFVSESPEQLGSTVGLLELSKAVLDLARPMLADKEIAVPLLLETIISTRAGGSVETGLVGANTVSILLSRYPTGIRGTDLTGTNLNRLNLAVFSRWNDEHTPDLSEINFDGANLENSNLGAANIQSATFRGSNLNNLRFDSLQIDSISAHPRDRKLAIGSYEEILIWDLDSDRVTSRTPDSEGPWEVYFDRKGEFLFHGIWGGFRIRDANSLAIISTHLNSVVVTESEEPENYWPGGFYLTQDHRRLFVGANNAAIFVWDLESRSEVSVLLGHSAPISNISASSNDRFLASCSSSEVIVWDTETLTMVSALRCFTEDMEKAGFTREGHVFTMSRSDGSIRRSGYLTSSKFHPQNDELMILTNVGELAIVDPRSMVALRKVLQPVGEDQIQYISVAFTADPGGQYVFLHDSEYLRRIEYSSGLVVEDSPGDVEFGPLLAIEQVGKGLFIGAFSGDVSLVNRDSFQVVARMKRLPRVEKADFRGAVGIEKQLARELKRHGALV